MITTARRATLWSLLLLTSRAWPSPPATSPALRSGLLGLLQSHGAQRVQPPPPPEAPKPQADPFLEMYQPYLDLADQDLSKLLDDSPGALPSACLGQSNRGSLLNSVPLPPGKGYRVNRPHRAYSTPEVVSAIQSAMARVHEMFPNAPPIAVGDLSQPGGGRMGTHMTHRNGLDADVGFAYRGPHFQWYKYARESNLDLPRTWALIRALLTQGPILSILINRPQQRLLYRYARFIGEDEAWLQRIFQYPKNRKGILKHCPGHATHLHVRFQSPLAETMGRRLYPLLLELGKVGSYYGQERVRVRKTTTVGQLAKRYGVSARTLKRINRLSSDRIKAGKRLRLPKRKAKALAPLQFSPIHTPPPPRYPERMGLRGEELDRAMERARSSQ